MSPKTKKLWIATWIPNERVGDIYPGGVRVTAHHSRYDALLSLNNWMENDEDYIREVLELKDSTAINARHLKRVLDYHQENGDFLAWGITPVDIHD